MKIEIEKLVHGGLGMGRLPADSGPQSGMRVFAPYTLPGELIEAELVEQRSGYGELRIQRIERESEWRIAPACPWFGVCGGCHLQHSAYSYQVELKRGILTETLTRAGVRELPTIESLADAPFEYRNRNRFQVMAGPPFAIGYRQAKSHAIAAVDQCPILVPVLEKSMQAIRALGQANRVPAGVAEIELFTNHNQSQLLLTAWTDDRGSFGRDRFGGFFSALQLEIPQLIGSAVLPQRVLGAREAKPLGRYGQQHLSYRTAGRTYQVGLGSFFQVNALLLDAFATAATSGLSGKIAWDLYAGVGLFSLLLAESFEHVIAVESNPFAARDLRTNLHSVNAQAVHSKVDQFLRKMADEIGCGRAAPPDAVLLDAPRKGMCLEACRLLTMCAPRSIVCVSCDAATLGRDLRALIQSGYRLHRLQMVDLFPQTATVETIATLFR
jgi:23S rRNA (uracil1939-C5)-methyltransferase